jgi:phage baseplate assembly protein W
MSIIEGPISLERPHFQQPFTFVPGQGVNVVEQDTPEHIQSCWYTIAACPTGFRTERPEFGWDQPFMRTMPVDFSGLVAAFQLFEPRVPDVSVTQAESVYGEVVQVTGQMESLSVNEQP